MKNTLGLVMWLLVTFTAAWMGSRFMPGEWYASLVKPSWNPPNYLFGPVWTVLYALMAVAAWLVWRQAGWGGAAMALGLFVFQLGLNALWSYLFFGLHRMDLALLEIVCLWLAILATMVAFWMKNHAGGALLAPYLAWVTFASYLNYVLWSLNRGSP